MHERSECNFKPVAHAIIPKLVREAMWLNTNCKKKRVAERRNERKKMGGEKKIGKKK